MAFKRSAVRSRLSPPPSPENHWFSGLFLRQNRRFSLKSSVLETALGNEYFAEIFIPELYQNYDGPFGPICPLCQLFSSQSGQNAAEYFSIAAWICCSWRCRYCSVISMSACPTNPFIVSRLTPKACICDT